MSTTTMQKSKPETHMMKPPADLFDQWREEMAMFYDRPFSLGLRPLVQRLSRLGKSLGEWAPTMDVFEKEGELVILADLPGLKKEDVQITIEEGDLVLKGERKMESTVNEENLFRAERVYGAFSRRLELPFVPDPTLVAAKFTDGVLEVKIPMPLIKKHEPKKVKIM
jgi:HSP20 family protein